MLALRARAINPNGLASVQLPHISSIRVAVNNLNTMIHQDFGDPLFHTHYEMRQAGSTEEIALEDMDTAHAAVTITDPLDIEEFPWATGEIEIVEVERDVAGQGVA